MIQTNIHAAGIYVRERRPFKTYGALYGIEGAVGVGPGLMPEPHRSVFLRHKAQGIIAYTVVSYATPIAWATTDGREFVPPVKYSRTTTKHQGKTPMTMEVDG